MEDLDYALNYLIQENKSYSTSQVPDSIDEKEKFAIYKKYLHEHIKDLINKQGDSNVNSNCIK